MNLLYPRADKKKSCHFVPFLAHLIMIWLRKLKKCTHVPHIKQFEKNIHVPILSQVREGTNVGFYVHFSRLLRIWLTKVWWSKWEHFFQKCQFGKSWYFSECFARFRVLPKVMNHSRSTGGVSLTKNTQANVYYRKYKEKIWIYFLMTHPLGGHDFWQYP